MSRRGLLDATYQAEGRHFWFRGLTRFAEALIERAHAAPLVARPVMDMPIGSSLLGLAWKPRL